LNFGCGERRCGEWSECVRVDEPKSTLSLYLFIPLSHQQKKQPFLPFGFSVVKDGLFELISGLEFAFLCLPP